MEKVVKQEDGSYKFLTPYEVPGVCCAEGNPVNAYRATVKTKEQLLEQKRVLEENYARDLAKVQARLDLIEALG